MKIEKYINKKALFALVLIVIFLLCLIPPKSNNSKYSLDIYGPYGDKEAYHPKVLSFNEKWNGYKYWMVYTPYPKGDDLKENPCIAVSNDLINWNEPKGYRSNPLDEPINKEKAKVYNSDAHLVYNEDLDRLECYWRFVDDHKNITIIYRRCSKNGINWDEKEIAFYLSDRKKADCISPAIIYENELYKMWYVQAEGVVKYAESIDGISWQNFRNINIEYASNLKTWHLDVIKTKNGYEMLTVAFPKWNQRNDMSLYYTSSKDGFNWVKTSKILEPATKTRNWDNKGIYRASFIYEDGIYYVFYSGTKKDYHHGIGLVVGRDINNLKGNNIDFSKENAVEKFNRMVEQEKRL